MLTWTLCIVGWALAVDGIRRPGWQWTVADRNRPFWMTFLIVLPVTFPIYLIFVFPRLVNSRTAIFPGFLEGPAEQARTSGD